MPTGQWILLSHFLYLILLIFFLYFRVIERGVGSINNIGLCSRISIKSKNTNSSNIRFSLIAQEPGYLLQSFNNNNYLKIVSQFIQLEIGKWFPKRWTGGWWAPEVRFNFDPIFLKSTRRRVYTGFQLYSMRNGKALPLMRRPAMCQQRIYSKLELYSKTWTKFWAYSFNLNCLKKFAMMNV